MNTAYGRWPFSVRGFKVTDQEGVQTITLDHDDTGVQFSIRHESAGDSIYADGEAWPMERIAVSSTTHIAYLEALGLSDRLVGVSWADHVLQADLRARIDSGVIIDLTRGAAISTEQLALSGAQVLFYDPSERDIRASARRVGVLAIPISEYSEVHPLARAAWLEVFGTLFGQRAEAERQFAHIADHYMALSTMAKLHSRRPQVLMGSVYQGKWYAPPSNSLAAQWIRDANADYALEGEEGSGNITLDMERLLTLGAEVDFYGQVGYGPFDFEELYAMDERLRALPALSAGQVFYCDSKEVDYFGSAILRPDIVLSDIISVLHKEVETGDEPTYFHLVPPPSAD